MVVSYKDLQNLAGYTYLVNELDTVINEVNEEKFVREKVSEELIAKYKGGQVRKKAFKYLKIVPYL